MADPKILGGLGKATKRLLMTDAEKSAARFADLTSRSSDQALPLILPRARMTPEFIDQQADRVARQMLGEHVTSGKPKDTTNLAGRSKKESQRVKGLDYVVKPTGNVAQETTYVPRKGDVKVALPGDQTVSDSVLESINGFPIDSIQQGGGRYGLGQKHLDDPEFWKSNVDPAKSVQGKVDRVAELYEPDRVIGTHLAMGPTSNNFAMHLADANLRAIDWSKAQPKKISVFDNIIAGGYKDPKTGERVYFPNWLGLADPDAALAAMKEDSNQRKWFNNRMKTSSLTEPLGLPNGLSIEYAITEPRIRDMEINMTGLMTGKLKPGAAVEAAGNPHNTYSHRILGEAEGAQEVLTPFVIDFPDAAQHIASTKRPSDFTGTIQKVFPHQKVDDQYIDEYNQYRERIKKLTGQKEGGPVNIEESDARLEAAMSQHMAKGGSVDIKAADARLSAAMGQRMAGGGGAFKKIAFMQEGGAAKGFKKLAFMVEGGGAFKTLQFKEPQRFDGGGIASPEESSVYSPESFFDSKRYGDIKKNAAEMYAETKKDLSSDYDRLKNSGRARAQLAKIAAMQLAGGAPDLAHLGIDLVVDPLKSVTVDKLLTKPKYRSVLEGPANPSSPRIEDQPQREPMFGKISDSLKTADGLPIGGSEHLMKRAQEAGLMSQGRFSPLTEIPAAIVGGLGLSKLSKLAGKGYQKHVEPRVDPAGALSRAITEDSNSLLPSFANSPLFAPQSVKLTGLQPEAKTASTGTPKGATYATKQEGPFYRVSPTSLDVSGAKSRGLREADELQGEAPIGGGAGQAGREVPLRISDEEVGRLIADPASNQPLQIAQRFTKETQGTDFAKPDIPESSLAKQSAIGRAHQLAVEGSPEYKSSVFDAYAKQMPDLLEQAGAKSYDDLMEKAYRQLAKETDEQFKQLPYNFSYHRAGEGDYLGGSKEMMADVHGNKHLYDFQGGDPHDFLNRMDKASGLNENEKFRAVHDLLGHAIYGNQFGPKGEELAYAVHQQMYSPLARLAMASETRGQNSLVNYSPLNVKLKSNIAKLEDLEVEAMRRKDTALVNEIRAAKRQEFASNFQFAPQKAVLLPPEFLDPKFAGGLPDYLSAANRPAKGTETQSVLTHFSNEPNLQMLDPTRYGTGIKGAEAERLRDYAGGVKDRSYVYLGEPGTISPESGLGVNRYRGESQNLYDITKDPLSFRALARESNRTPFTAKVNAGITSPLQEANDYERLVKEYGYEGMINPNASKPMGIMFRETPVQPRKRGGLTQLRAR